MKTYSQCPVEIRAIIDRLIRKFHPELEKAHVYFDLLFVTGEPPALTCRGAPAYAVVKINSRKDRVKGAGDAEITIDRDRFEPLCPETKDALLDHEIFHVMHKRDRRNELAFHADGHPKLKLRKHDREFGWFDEIARRHGQYSIECQQAKLILNETAQLYFQFHDEVPRAPRLLLQAAKEEIETKKRRRPAA